MNPKKYVLLSALVAVIILTILFNLGDITSKEITEYIPPIAIQSQTAAVSDFNSSLVAHYTFDDTTNDSAGSNNGTASGGPTYVAGKIGQALSFDGIDDYINVGSGASLRVDTPSVSVWLKRNTLNECNLIQSATTGYTFWLRPDGRLQWGKQSGGPWAIAWGAQSVGTWIHFVGTYDGSNLVIYKNGVQIATEAVSSMVWGSSGNIQINKGLDGVCDSVIDDFRIYSRALTSDEVSELYNSGGTTPIPTPDSTPIPTPTPEPTPTPQPTPIPDPVVVTPPPVQQQAPPATSGSQTYYIDYVSGNNANNGTSKTTPWKVHPFMKGFTGSYSHKAGDRFIFKGGVTWPNDVFPLSIIQGGNVASPDYYGVDATWYNGTSWERPIFNAQGKVISTPGSNAFILVGADYVVLDNFNMDGYYWNAASMGSSKFAVYIAVGNSHYVSIRNCYFHGWSHDSLQSGTNDDLVIVLGWSKSTGEGNEIVNSVFDGTGPGSDSGAATYTFPTVKNSTVRNMPNAFLVNGTNAEISGNHIGPITKSFSGSHENSIEDVGVTGTLKIFNNIIHDSTGVTLFLGGFNNTLYLYNNIIYNSFPIPIRLETRVPDSRFTGRAYIYNNTIESSHDPYPCITNGGGTWDYLDIRNNHCISDAGLFWNGYGGFNTLINNNNLVQTHTQATAQGYVFANKYAPSNAVAETINKGVPILLFTTDKDGNPRGVGDAWDIGAYEYQGSGTPTTPPVTPPTYKPGDFNRDGAVNALDFSLLSGAWNTNTSTYDLNSDSIVNSLDYVIMVQNWTG